MDGVNQSSLRSTESTQKVTEQVQPTINEATAKPDSPGVETDPIKEATDSPVDTQSLPAEALASNQSLETIESPTDPRLNSARHTIDQAAASGDVGIEQGQTADPETISRLIATQDPDILKSGGSLRDISNLVEGVNESRPLTSDQSEQESVGE